MVLLSFPGRASAHEQGERYIAHPCGSDHLPSQPIQRRFATCLLLSGVIFLIDLQLPLGVAGGVPYVLVILLALPFPDRRFIFGFGILVSALTAFGYLLSAAGSPEWMVIVNRLLALFAIWATAFLGLRQRRTLERLTESENRFDLLANAASFIIWRADKEGHWTDISGGWLRFPRTDAHPINPVDWKSYVHPDELGKVESRYQEALTNRVTIQFECRMRDTQGVYHWVSLQGAPYTNATGVYLGYLGTIVDIDARVRAVQRYRASEARYRAVTENLLIGIALCSESGNILATNQTATKLFGISMTELIGRSICDLLVEPTCSYSPGCLHKFSVDNLSTTHSHETIGVRSDGSRFPLELSFTTYYEDGVRHHIAALRDITRQQMAESALTDIRSRQQHRDKMAAIGRLAAGLVHEIGNPLSAIVGVNQTLRQALESGSKTNCEELPRYLQQIEQNLDRILSVTRDISEFAEITPRHRTLVNLNQLVERTCRMVEYEHAGSRVPIHYLLDAELPAVPLVADHLVQMLLHLLHNAVEACQQTTRHPEITVMTGCNDHFAQVRIRDNGCGMPAEMLDRVSEAFFTGRTAGGGMGLGLALCHAVVAEYDGSLQFESTVTQGTTVTVSLPVAVQSSG